MRESKSSSQLEALHRKKVNHNNSVEICNNIVIQGKLDLLVLLNDFISGKDGKKRNTQQEEVLPQPDKRHYARFSKKIRELSENKSSRNQNWYGNNTETKGRVSRYPRRVRNQSFVKDEAIQLRPEDIAGVYGTQAPPTAPKIEIGNMKTVRASPFENVKFDMDKINPIIRKLSSRRSSNRSTAYM